MVRKQPWHQPVCSSSRQTAMQGEGGPEAFFSRVGFEPVDETEYGEVVAEIRL